MYILTLAWAPCISMLLTHDVLHVSGKLCYNVIVRISCAGSAISGMSTLVPNISVLVQDWCQATELGLATGGNTASNDIAYCSLWHAVTESQCHPCLREKHFVCPDCCSWFSSCIPIYFIQKADGRLNLSSLGPPAHILQLITACICTSKPVHVAAWLLLSSNTNTHEPATARQCSTSSQSAAAASGQDRVSASATATAFLLTSSKKEHADRDA